MSRSSTSSTPLGLTKTLTSRSLLEVRVGVNRTDAGKSAFGTGEPNMLEAYGITGLPTDAVFSGGLTEQGVGGWTTWGRQNSNPQYQNPFVINTRINYSWLRGKHSLKTGYEYQRINTEVDDVNPKYGQDIYGGQFSRPAGAAADTATYNLADFLMGARSSYSLVNPFIIELRQRMHFGYIQDDWRASDKLTVNLGLRYEFATPQWDANNKLTNFDPATRTLLQAKDGSIYDRSLVNPDKNNFGPRLGMAYSINDKTVLRSAYGIGYVLFNRLGGENLLPFNGPHVVPVSITQQPSQGLCTATQAPTTCFRTTQMGYPEGLNVPANFNPLNGRVNYIPPDIKTGQIQNWHVTVQRELGANFVVDVAYVANKSEHLMVLGDLNQARPNANGENLTLQARRPIQGYQFIQSAFDGGRGDYRAMQLKVERRYQQRVLLPELVHLVTHARQRVGPSRNRQRRQQPRQLRERRRRVRHLGLRPAAQQRDDRGVGSAVRPRALVWRLARHRGEHDDQRPAGEPELLAGRCVPGQHRRDPSPEHRRRDLRGRAVGAPSGSTRPTSWCRPTRRSRSATRREMRRAVPRSTRWISALHKDLRIGGSRRMQFRLETFNVLNRTNLGAPNSNRSNANFGSITTLAIQPRQVQLGLKFDF